MSVEFGQKIGQKLMVHYCFFSLDAKPEIQLVDICILYKWAKVFYLLPKHERCTNWEIMKFNLGTRELNADLKIFIWKIISDFIQKILEYPNPSDLQNHSS